MKSYANFLVLVISILNSSCLLNHESSNAKPENSEDYLSKLPAPQWSLIINDKLELNWDSKEDYSTIILQRSNSNTPSEWRNLYTTSGTTVLYIDSEVETSSTYLYRIHVINENHVSYYSEIASVTFTVGQIETDNSNSVIEFYATINERGYIHLSWQGNAIDETSYLIERAPYIDGTTGSWVTLQTLAPNSNTATDDSVVEGSTYWYRITATKEEADSVSSEEIRIHLPPAVTTRECTTTSWKNGYTGTMSSAGLGLRESNTLSLYGSDFKEGSIITPNCAYLVGDVKIPVLLIDWADFEPNLDPADENSPDSSIFSNYSRSSSTAVSEMLNGSDGPAQYFNDVSGGKVNLSFDVFGWIRTDATGSYLKKRSSYLTFRDSTYIKCDSDTMLKDALKNSIAFHGMNTNSYDKDKNHFIDGVVMVYEGGPGFCNGLNMRWLTKWFIPERDEKPAEIYPSNANKLVNNSDPNASLFLDQNINLHFYNNISEKYAIGNNDQNSNFIWAHELGHTFWGFQDYYEARFNMGSWALSANGNNRVSHPAAFEKWLFAGWIMPTQVNLSGIFTLHANEIADGTSYADEVNYLLKIEIDGNPSHFITVENRWFDSDGNSLTKWAASLGKESGLLVIEFNMENNYWSTSPPQIYRHIPTREGDLNQLAYKNGDIFTQCFSTQCISIKLITKVGGEVMVEVDISALQE